MSSPGYRFDRPAPADKLARILAMVRAAPSAGIATRAIAAGMHMKHSTAKTYLAELRRREEVHTVGSGPYFFWHAGKSPDPKKPRPDVPSNCLKPKQRTVSTWELHLHRDPLDAMLFGPAKR